MIADRSGQVADYLLGSLEPEEAAAFERAMARDPGLAREVTEGMARLHALDDTAEPVAADDALWSRIAQAIGQPARSGSAERAGFGALWDSLRFWRWMAMGGLAAGAILAIGLAAVVLRPAPGPRLVAILVPADSAAAGAIVEVQDDGAAAGAIVEVQDDGAARLIPLQDIPVPKGQALEVWTLPSRERGPVSVGLIERARQAELAVDSLPAIGEAQLFEITLEPATGSPVGRPTGPVLFKGLTVQAL